MVVVNSVKTVVDVRSGIHVVVVRTGEVVVGNIVSIVECTIPEI